MTYYSKEEIRSRCFRKDGKISRHICPEILTFMHSTFPDLKNVKSMIRAYVFNNESDKCEKCNLEIFSETMSHKGFLCDKCRKLIRSNSTAKTLMLRYGVDHVSRIPGIQEKKISTNMEKYGVAHYIELESVKDKNRSILKRINVSKGEKRLADTIEKTFNVIVIRNDRKVLNGKEIDIWIPEYNLGIEYNGIYWHSSDEAKKADHNKMILAESVGIKLLQFWCYEVDNEIDKVLEIISGNFV